MSIKIIHIIPSIVLISSYRLTVGMQFDYSTCSRFPVSQLKSEEDEVCPVMDNESRL